LERSFGPQEFPIIFRGPLDDDCIIGFRQGGMVVFSNFLYLAREWRMEISGDETVRLGYQLTGLNSLSRTDDGLCRNTCMICKKNVDFFWKRKDSQRNIFSQFLPLWRMHAPSEGWQLHRI